MIEFKSFDAEAIRDTSSHDGTITEPRDYHVKTIIIENGLNQDVTLTCKASANSDFSNSFTIASFDVTASTNSYQTCDSLFPYFRLSAQCDTAPTSGTLTVFVYGVQ